MTKAQRGQARGFDPDYYSVDQAPADGVVVVTENDWNERMGSVTVAGVFKRDEHPAPGDPTIVDLGDGDYVDCTQIFPVPKKALGTLWTPPLTPQEIGQVTGGVRAHLCIDQFTAMRACPAAGPPEPGEGWWPEQGMVRKVEWPPGDWHMMAVLSSTCRNRELETSTGVLLTKHRHSWRDRWEVPTPGGCTVPGDIFTFRNQELRTSAEYDRPDRLAAESLAAVANAVQRILVL